MKDFEIFIGLEIHVQLLTTSKMFCECKPKFGESPNTNVCPVCLGYPGILPVPNMNAVDYAYRIAQSLQCDLSKTVQFDRKNYYYPDLPKNYQLTQFYHPVGRNGIFHFEYNNEITPLHIIEAHLEEDAGKLVHTSDVSLCDYNRSGTPLMEIVTAPDLKSPAEAETMLKQFRRLMRYLEVCDGNMEEGSLRCDANISLNHHGKGLGQKVEIKNVNSFRFVRMALEFEIGRQSKLLEVGTPIIQETRLWNENRDITESMRTKEDADDYRYLPDPDIIPYRLPESFFETLRNNRIESPLECRARFKKDYNLEEKVLDFFTDEKKYADFFEQTIEAGASATLIATWGLGDVQKQLHKGNYEIDTSPLTPKRFGAMLALLQEGAIHGKLAKKLLEYIFSDDEDPAVLVEKYNLVAISEEEIQQAVNKVLSAHPEAMAQIQSGDKKPLGFLMGKIMSETGGKADPQSVQKILALSFGITEHPSPAPPRANTTY